MRNDLTEATGLSAEQAELLARLLENEITNPSLTQTIRPHERSARVPLSYAQQRLWFLTQLAPDSPAYNVIVAMRLDGALQATALELTLNEIVRRHESLRTLFPILDGNPAQAINPPTRLPLQRIDLRGLPATEREAEAVRIARADNERPFDLERGPLFRVTLLQLHEQTHVLVLSMHHIIADAWSMMVLVRELSVIYEAYSHGRPSPLAELPIQYADYAIWQLARLGKEVLEDQLAYWTQQLGGSHNVLQLPTDFPRPPVQTFNGTTLIFQLSQELTDSLKAFSQRQGVTLFMTLLASFNVLLHRYTNERYINVGSPIANRTWAELEGLIGFLTNTLVLRTDLSGDPSFRDLVKRVREVAIKAYAHQDLPFERLVEELEPERDTSHTPLFQVLFTLQNPPVSPEKVSNLSLSLLNVENSTAKFDLMLSMVEQEHGLTTMLEYNSDIFKPETIDRMVRHFRILLESVSADPTQRISEISLVQPGERQQLLVEWNDTQTRCPEDSIHGLFEEQAAMTPEAIAISFRGSQLTYRELNERANQLAHHLQKLGVGAESLVGILVEPGVDMIAGLLGILKAGGAYVPLSAVDPAERIALIIEGAGVSVLLAQQRLLEKLPAPRASVVCLDSVWNSLAHEAKDNPNSNASADNTAYLMHTSGSTGKPKGVLVTHRGVVRLVKETNYVEMTADEVFLQLAPLSFDASTFEIWGSLLNGARLVIFPARVIDLNEVAACIEQNSITTLWLTASLFNQMVEDHLETLKKVRQLLAGGEALSTMHVRKYLQELQEGHLINGYGPTENTTFTCCFRMNNATRVDTSVHIGRPIANTQVYILDSELRLMPVGLAGELHIGGGGLARGYFMDPSLTAEKFIPHPFSRQQGARLYQTGDLARYLEDGRIEFLGRLDNQVKVRGFRIEPGEIEAALTTHDAVSEALVIVKEVGSDKRLVAYVVCEQGATVNGGELAAYLKAKLPNYMIPSAFVMLPDFPLTPNGKVDRRILPDPVRWKAGPETDSTAPRTPVEEVLAGIWAQVLGLEEVSINENFFDLGGHSLSATQAMSRIREAFQLELPLSILFASPTVARIAECVESELRKDSASQVRPITRRASGSLAPLSHAQGRLLFHDHLERGSALYNVPAAIRFSGTLHLAALEQSFNEVIRRHEALRTRFGAVDGQSVQIISQALTVEVPLLDLSELQEEERAAVVKLEINSETLRPFDLGCAPLLRIKLLRLSETEHVLVLVMHHTITDGWSTGVLIRELASLYVEFSNGRESSLPELPVQYADFAQWQREHLQGEVLNGHLVYWKRQLAGAPDTLDFPFAKPRPAIRSFRGSSYSWALDKALTEELKALSRREGATLFMTLLAAFKVMLFRYTQQTDIQVGTDVANRNHKDLETLIGLFVNQLVLRSKLSVHQSFRQLLTQIREVSLAAYTHQDLPFDLLVKALKPKRSLNRNPLFQVLFVLQNTPSPDLQLPGLTLQQVEIELQRSKFDLAFFTAESESGLVGSWVYSTDLFDDLHIRAMGNQFQILLRSIVARPDARLSELEMSSEVERQQQQTSAMQRRQVRGQKLVSVRRNTDWLQPRLVKTDYFDTEQRLPLVIRPNMRYVDLVDWARNNPDFIETQLIQHGALLFRGFNLSGIAEFEQFASATCSSLYGEYGDLPREELHGKVYGSTPYAADQVILFHNESSHLNSWPRKIWFCCVTAALRNGETPLVDCRKVFQAMDAGMVETFLRRQLLYVRNFADRLDVSWQDFFRTTDRAQVEKYCRANSIQFQWIGTEGLRTSQVRPAIVQHPVTNEFTFFNQIFLHHPSCLQSAVRESLLSLYREEDLPRNVYYGDGGSLEDEVVAHLRKLYDEFAVAFPWQERDIVMLDNMLISHARNPFTGQRKIVVALGDVINSAVTGRGA